MSMLLANESEKEEARGRRRVFGGGGGCSEEPGGCVHVTVQVSIYVKFIDRDDRLFFAS